MGVGPPRTGLTPGLGRYPGSWVPESEAVQHLYRRIRYPSDSIFPSDDLYLDRDDLTPRGLTGSATVVQKDQVFAVRVLRHARRFAASFLHDGFFNVHGVFSSGSSGKLPPVVELSDGDAVIELASGRSVADLAPSKPYAVEVE